MDVDFRHGFRNLIDEVTDVALVPDRPLPAWLDGVLFRVGGAINDTPTGRVAHWFDGYAMAHRFHLSGGGVRYTNRLVQSPAYTAMVESQRPRFNEYMTVPRRSLWEKLQVTLDPTTAAGHNGLVHVLAMGDRIVAQSEEPGGPVLDPVTLDTIGQLAHRDDLGGLMDTAHPIIDPRRRCVWNVLTQVSMLGPLHYVPYRIDDGTTTRTPIAVHRTDRVTQLHSFGASENFVIIAEFPWVATFSRLATMALTARPYGHNFEWRPELGSRFLVFHKDTGELLAPFETEAAFSFHHANAYEDGRDLVVDLSVYEDAAIVDALRFSKLDEPGGGNLPFSWLRRYRLGLDTGAVSYEDIATSQMFEMPQLNPARHGRPCQQLYGYSFPRDGAVDQFINQIIKIDATTGSHSLWADDGCFPGEPVFVPRPGSDGEDDGVLVSLMFDGRAERSALVVLDAATLDEISRAPLPFAVPFGFHGRFYPS